MFCEENDVCLHVLYAVEYWVKVFVFVVGAYSFDVSEVDAEVMFGECGLGCRGDGLGVVCGLVGVVEKVCW